MLTNRPICLSLLLLVLTSLLLLPVTFLIAHSGRTDKYGGHWNRKTGTYHYHSTPSSSVPRQTPSSPNPSPNVDLPLETGIIQNIIIDAEGKASISLAFRFKLANVSIPAKVFMQELGYLFYELQENYDFIRTQEGDYLICTFDRLSKVDITQTKYMTFSKKENGAYSFTITIPPTMIKSDYYYGKSPVILIKVTLPKEIDIANTMDYQGNTAVWILNQTDLETKKVLRADTKP